MVKRLLEQNTFGVVGTRRSNPSSRLLFNAGDGTLLAITYDRATTSHNIRIKSMDMTTGTVTSLASVAAPFAFSDVTAAMFPNGDLGIVVVESVTGSFTRNQVYYVKYTKATNTFSAWEDTKNDDDFVLSIDAAVTENNHFILAINGSDKSSGFGTGMFCRITLRIRMSSDTTWIENIIAADAFPGGSAAGIIGSAKASAISIATLGVTQVGYRDIAVYWGRGVNDTDYGVSGMILRANATFTGWQMSTEDTNLMAGDVPAGGNTPSNATPQSLGGRLIRIYEIPSGGVSKFFVTIAHAGSNSNTIAVFAKRFSTVPSTLDLVDIMPIQSSTMSGVTSNMHAISAYIGGSAERMKAGAATVTFAAFKSPGNTNLVIKSMVFRFTAADFSAGEFSGMHEHGIPEGLSSLYSMHSLGNKYLEQSKNAILVESYAAFNTTAINSWEIMFADLAMSPAVGGSVPQAIKSTNPADGSIVATANPLVTSQVDIDLNNGQSRYKVHVQFAKNTGFTTSLIDWYPGNADWTYVAGTLSGPSIPVSATLPNTYSLTNGSWYMRARLMDEYGTFGPWVTTRVITVGHPPQAGPPFSPQNAVEWIPIETEIPGANPGLIRFDWEFTDTSPTDSQTAFQVRVYRASNNSLVHESGKRVSTDTFYNLVIGPEWKDVEWYWQVKLWDTDDVSGSFTSAIHFIVTDPPVVTVDYPTSGVTVATGVPTVTGNIDISGGRDVKEYTVSITQGGVPIWSKRVIGPLPDGYVFAEKVPQGYLQDGQSYTLQVSAIEAGGLQSTSGMIPFLVDWIPPAGPNDITADISHYNTDGEGFVLVGWGDATREAPNFVGWNVYRKSDLLNTDSGVVIDEGELVLIHQERAIGTSYQHQDYFAPSGYRTTYFVTQVVNRDGQDIESDKIFFAQTVPQSDGYWLLAPSDFDGEDEAFKLSNVTGDNFTHEREESEIIVIGVGRTFQKGQDLGVKGTLDAQLRHTNGTTARQKKLKIEQLTDSGARLWLRNPFGDITPVNVSGVSITRVAGVGVSEFCDIQIPYSEVGR